MGELYLAALPVVPVTDATLAPPECCHAEIGVKSLEQFAQWSRVISPWRIVELIVGSQEQWHKVFDCAQDKMLELVNEGFSER
jgi:hypothetical protein